MSYIPPRCQKLCGTSHYTTYIYIIYIYIYIYIYMKMEENLTLCKYTNMKKNNSLKIMNLSPMKYLNDKGNEENLKAGKKTRKK